jgi:hypothetical protein
LSLSKVTRQGYHIFCSKQDSGFAALPGLDKDVKNELSLAVEVVNNVVQISSSTFLPQQEFLDDLEPHDIEQRRYFCVV